MKMVEMFDHRNLVASKIKDCLRDRGYTKISFAEKSGISRPTLDKMLNGQIENKKTFEKHIQKIMDTLNLSADELISYQGYRLIPMQTVNSQNAPDDYKRTDKAQQEYELLLDIIDLCAIYY